MRESAGWRWKEERVFVILLMSQDLGEKGSEDGGAREKEEDAEYLPRRRWLRRRRRHPGEMDGKEGRRGDSWRRGERNRERRKSRRTAPILRQAVAKARS